MKTPSRLTNNKNYVNKFSINFKTNGKKTYQKLLNYNLKMKHLVLKGLQYRKLYTKTTFWFKKKHLYAIALK